MAPKSRARDSKLENKKGSKNSANAIVENLDEKVNKPKRKTVAELTKELEAATKRIKDLEEYSAQRNKDLAAAEALNKQLQEEGNQKSEGIQILNDALKTSQNRIGELENTNKDILNGAKSLVNRGKALREDNERLSKTNQDYRTQNSILTESIRQSALKSPEEVAKAQKELESTSEPKAEESQVNNTAQAEKVKTDNSGTAEETATPETGETKVEGEPEVKTEQATQEPKSEAKQPLTESSEMTPEEVYDYLSDKKNFKDAERYFVSGKDDYIGTNDKHIPKSWFDVYKGNKDSDHSMFRSPNNKDVFTASLRDKGLLKDSNKKPDRAETERVQAETEAKRKFDEGINSRGNKLKGIIGRHPWLTGGLALSVGAPAILKLIDELGDWGAQKAIDEDQVPDSEFFGGNQETNDGPDSEKVTEDLTNAAQETEQAGNTAEEQAAQALRDNLPQGVADAIEPSGFVNRVTDNATPPASNTASGTSSNAKQALEQGSTTVADNAPVTNAGSSGMTYNANNPDMVTADLINAMNQAPQAGSDAIGYGDLYDQNFIDFWAKRNPNLAFGVSQGRKA